MIRSIRNDLPLKSKLTWTRRWASAICTDKGPTAIHSASSVHSFCFRQGPNSSNIHDDRISNYSVLSSQVFRFHKNQLRFFSTKEDDFSKKDEVDINEKQNMHDKPNSTVWDQLKSVPNIITVARLASTPLICYWIITDQPKIAFVGCFVAGISDVLDGYIAKNHGGSTVLGGYLDPFADKFFINSLAVSLWYNGTLPGPLVGLWASKDVILLGGMGWYLYQEQRTINFFSNSIHTKPLTVTPSILGKANTGLQFATLFIGIITPIAPIEMLHPAVLQNLCWVTGASSIVTTLSYAAGRKGFKYTSAKVHSEEDKGRNVDAAEGHANRERDK